MMKVGITVTDENMSFFFFILFLAEYAGPLTHSPIATATTNVTLLSYH